MSSILTPKFKRNFYRVLPFGFIWLILGWVFLLTETLVTGNQNLTPDSAVSMSPRIFLFASVAVFIVGILFGIIEQIILQRRFRYYSFPRKVFFKFLIYVGFVILIVDLSFPIATSIELGLPMNDDEVIRKTLNFYSSTTFVSTVMQMSFHILVSLIYSAISENLGHQVLFNFFTGKYHSPKNENRIFMFLDMKDSTTLAEKLGHEVYFSLLQDYYELMSDPIISTLGEVYQYIGDEVVITWQSERGIQNQNCVKCYFLIKEKLDSKADYFKEKYNIVPGFKAGLHMGEVTTGEIGALKREIIYTGDVLNTTARIQSLCNQYDSELLISSPLIKALGMTDDKSFQQIGAINLKGKSQKTELYSRRSYAH